MPATTKRGMELIRQAQRDAVSPDTTHSWDWFEFRRALCSECGLVLHLIATLHPRQGKFGRKTIAVWGGNEFGVGGVFEEPECRGPRAAKRFSRRRK